MALLSFLASAHSSMALVGPAREAPEWAPYVLMVMAPEAGEASFCTASVIAQDVILTAAHCVADISETRAFFRTDSGKLVFIDVSAIAINPGFRRNAGRKRSLSIDLALLRLSAPLPDSFKPLEISTSATVAAGQAFRLLGFGRASETRSGTSGILRQGTVVARGPKSPLLLWLVDPAETGLGGCTGDSGGPVLSLDRPLLIAVAIRALGFGGYACGAMTEAVLIAPQLPWLRQTLQKWGITPAEISAH